jgi:hypothetical protein
MERPHIEEAELPVEPGLETLFTPEDRVFVQVEVEQDDEAWIVVEGAGFPGTVTYGRAMDRDGQIVSGIQVLPDYDVPVGDRYASGAPWSVTGRAYWTDLADGTKIKYRVTAISLAKSE